MPLGPAFTRIMNATSGGVRLALEWFRSRVAGLVHGDIEQEQRIQQAVSQQETIHEARGEGDPVRIRKLFKMKEHIEQGRMYLFRYDPKYKLVLPYYDEYPLVFPLHSTKGGFLGMNLHYLPNSIRTGILNTLMEYSSDDKFDDETKLRISYQTLENSSIMFNAWYKDCIRRYLYSHVMSHYDYVSPEDWSFVSTLPTEKWVYKLTHKGL